LHESDLARFCHGAPPDERWVSFTKMQIERARSLYASAALGVAALALVLLAPIVLPMIIGEK